MKKLLAVLAVLILLGGGVWWGVAKFAGQSARVWRTAPLRAGEIVSTVSSTGALTPVVNVQVGTPVSGIVKELFADYNSQVKAGQAIAQIDPAVFRAQADQADGNHRLAEANLAKALATEEDAERTLRRYENLVRDGLLARSDYDTAETALKTARASRLAAAASVVQARGQLDLARTNLDYSTIRSPVDGIVISRNVDVGQTVAASLQSPTLFVIAQDLAEMEIDVSVDEADVSRISVGAPVSFTVDAYPDARFQGGVRQVRNSPVTVQNVVTYVVVVAVDNADLRLKPGMTANVTFETARREKALIAPNQALRFKPRDLAEPPGAPREALARQEHPQGRLWVQGQDGRPRPVRVRTGIGNGRETEIMTTELKPGDLVIVDEPAVKGKPDANSRMPMGPRF